MIPSSWSIVDYGTHGPPCPSHPQPTAQVFHLTLRPGAQHGWTATPCYVWTGDGGQWITVAELATSARAAVLDTDFDLSPEQIAMLRGMHRAIGTSHYLFFVTMLTLGKPEETRAWSGERSIMNPKMCLLLASAAFMAIMCFLKCLPLLHSSILHNTYFAQ